MSRAGVVLGALALAVSAMAGTANAAPAPGSPDVTDGAAVGDGKAPSPVKKPGDVTTDISPGNGACEVFEFCLYRLNGFQGSLADVFLNVPDLAGATYPMWGPGFGEPISNNSQSAFNGDPDFFVITCTDPGYSGQCGYVPPINGGDFLPDFFLNVESFYFSS
jgi:hypothetical protein